MTYRLQTNTDDTCDHYVVTYFSRFTDGRTSNVTSPSIRTFM